MNPWLRSALQALFVTVMVPAGYLASCLMGQRYDQLQMWLYLGFGLLFGLGFAARDWWRNRAAARRSG